MTVTTCQECFALIAPNSVAIHARWHRFLTDSFYAVAGGSRR